MTVKVEFSRFLSLLNKTNNLKEKNRKKINKRKHLYSIFFAYKKIYLGKIVRIFFFFFCVAKQFV